MAPAPTPSAASMVRASSYRLGVPIIDQTSFNVQPSFAAAPAEEPTEELTEEPLERHVGEPVEQSLEFLDPYELVTNDSTHHRTYLGDASALWDWSVLTHYDGIGPSVGNGFFPPTVPHQPFLAQPVAGIDQNYQLIAPAPAPAPAAAARADVLVPPNLLVGARRRGVEPRIHCPTDGCTTSFCRPGDRRRHMRTHQESDLRCIVKECDMKFNRLDKVRDHLRQGHKMKL